MTRLWLSTLVSLPAAVLFLLGVTPPSSARPKSEQATITCYCVCHGYGGEIQKKTWAWSGNRDGCQGHDGAQCNITDDSGKFVNRGTLHSCDVIVEKPGVKGPAVTPVQPPSKSNESGVNTQSPTSSVTPPPKIELAANVR